MKTATATYFDDASFPSCPGFTLVPLGGLRYRIILRCGFAPGWIGSFTGRLADRRFNIINGYARKINPAVWHAVFEFETDAGVDASQLDFLELADGKLDWTPPQAVHLDDYRIAANPDGCVSVHISGRDQLGLLGSLLKEFHLYMLFPNEVVVETTAGRVKDFFRLRAMGGAAPSREAITALEEALRSMTRRVSDHKVAAYL